MRRIAYGVLALMLIAVLPLFGAQRVVLIEGATRTT